MAYVLVNNGTVAEYPYSVHKLRLDHPHVSFPIEPTELQLAEFSVYPVLNNAPPVYDALTQKLTEQAPALVASVWTQQWAVSELSAAEVDAALQAAREAMVVTPFQAKAALLDADLLDDIEALMADPLTDRVVVLAWNNAIQFERLSPMVAGIAAALGWTDEQLDTLFEAAALKTA